MEDAHILHVVEAGAILGESPVWSPDEGVLWWLDIKAPALYRYDPATGVNDSWPLPQETGSIVLRKDGGLVGALRGGVAPIARGASGPDRCPTPMVHPRPISSASPSARSTASMWTGRCTG